MQTNAFRRAGAIALLVAWVPAATANALTCAVWCQITGQTGEIHVGAHGDGAGHAHGQGEKTVSQSSCGAPDLLIVTALPTPAAAVPPVVTTTGELPAAALATFISPHLAFDTPPPRS